MDSLTVVGRVLLALAMVGMLTFAVRFAMTRWWKSEMGWHLMSLAVVEGMILGLSLLSIVLGRPMWLLVVNTCAFTVFVGIIWWRFVILERAQLRARQKKRQKEDAL